MKKSILNISKALNKTEQKKINGGEDLEPSCYGTGTGGDFGEGFSSACIGQPSGTQCIINGYLAVCTGNSGGFLFY